MSWFQLNHLATFPVSGAEARAFLHAQLTVDVSNSAPAGWFPAAWCTPKGRTEAFMLIRMGDENVDDDVPRVDIAVPAREAGDIVQRLGMFTIGRKVRIGAPGPLRGQLEAGNAGTVVMDQARAMDSGEAPENPGALKRWMQADLCAGLPWLSAAARGRHLPQVLGLEALGGLSYRKGCYPGQEVIARTHYLGTVKRHLLGFTGPGPGTPEPGSPISGQDGQSAGEVVWALGVNNGSNDGSTDDANNRVAGLAVVKAACTAGQTVEILGQRAELTFPQRLC